MSIEIRNLRKSFGEKEVLKGIDFSFEAGKINMIIGASGSGKSVMLKCIVGLLEPDEGEVLYDGVPFHQVSKKELKEIRKNIGMLFQSSALFDSMTVEENVSFPLKLFGAGTPAEIRDRVDYCLERVQMPNVHKLYPAELSGGMQKRVGLARAIAICQVRPINSKPILPYETSSSHLFSDFGAALQWHRSHGSRSHLFSPYYAWLGNPHFRQWACWAAKRLFGFFLYGQNLSFLNLTAPIFLEIARYSSKNLLVRTKKSSVWARNTKTQTASKY